MISDSKMHLFDTLEEEVNDDVRGTFFGRGYLTSQCRRLRGCEEGDKDKKAEKAGACRPRKDAWSA